MTATTRSNRTWAMPSTKPKTDWAEIIGKVIGYWLAALLSAAIDMVFLRWAHNIDPRIPAFGYLVVLFLTIVLSSPCALALAQTAKKK